MKINDLVGKGYFTEELPPPFNTIQLAQKINKVKLIISSLSRPELNKLKETNFVKYSIPRVGIHRRVNGIPNPFHQIKLSEGIILNWLEIKNHYKRTKLSASIPEIKKGSKRAIVQFDKYERFKEKCIESSFDTYFELRSDISNYFPSIYTHSIAWAIHTKAIAKKKRHDPKLYGNRLDELIRAGQEGQTIGIPIGTDTSRIISEIIGSAIDFELTNKLKKENISLKGYRFVDDIHFFFYTQADAEKALKHFHKILGGFNLNIHEIKTKINKTPFFFENNWNNQLNSFRFSDNSYFQRIDLRNYFNLLLNLSKQYPNDYVIKYGIKKLRSVRINEENWKLYESLFFSLTIAESSILPDLLAILLQNETFIDKNKLKLTIVSLLNQHIYKGNHFEVSWTLWIARTFNIKLSKDLAQKVLDSMDIVSILILLDIRQAKNVPYRLNLDDIKVEFNKNGLTNEFWLLVYEASHKGWISSAALSEVQFFEELSRMDISFYDANKQIPVEQSNIIPKKPIIPVKTQKIKSRQKLSIY